MELVLDGLRHLQRGWEWSLSVADPRVADWLLMDSPVPTIVLTLLYLLMVWQGPKFMDKRQPMVTNSLFLFGYNAALVALNFHIFYELLVGSWKAGYSYSCQPVRVSTDENEMRVAKALWWYYFSKLVEFLDTAFFILRKKDNQVTFLHVYHHATMFPLWWIGVKWVPGGQSFFGAMINSFIHVVMYTYYGISSLGPQYQKYVWWKKYLTRLQLIQFFIGMIYGLRVMYLQCDFPLWMQYSCLAYGTSMIVLFLNFYYKTYTGGAHPARRQQQQQLSKDSGKENGSALSKKRGESNGHSNGSTGNGEAAHPISNGHAKHE